MFLCTIMSERKRKAPSAAKEPDAKQQKLAPMKEEKAAGAGGWLQEVVKQQRTDNKMMGLNKKRLRFISDTKKVKQGSEGVLYWMSRDHRVQGKDCQLSTVRPDLKYISTLGRLSHVFLLCDIDNWALVHAQQLAVKENLPLHVCFCLHVRKSELSTLRHYSFMLKGLQEVAQVLTSRCRLLPCFCSFFLMFMFN